MDTERMILMSTYTILKIHNVALLKTVYLEMLKAFFLKLKDECSILNS